MVKNKFWEYAEITLMSLVALAIFYPIVMMVIISFKTNTEYIINPYSMPTVWEWRNYVTAYIEMNYLKSLSNSAILTAGAAMGGTFFSAIAAYGIARAQRCQKLFAGLFFFFWLGLALPQQVIMVPLTLWMKTLGLSNSLFGLMLVYVAVNAAYGVFFFTGFVKTVPIALEEAATIDGASPFRILISIVLPLLSTPMVTLLIIMILRVYNNFMLPLILLQGQSSRTLPLTIYFFKGDNAIEWPVMFAATTLTVLPLMIVYFIFQRKLLDGMLSGGVKM